MPHTETIQFEATPEFRRELEARASKLNLSLSAYLLYLHKRALPSQEAVRLDRLVHEVFGRHGELLRWLAK